MHAIHSGQLKRLRLLSAHSIDPVDPVEKTLKQALSYEELLYPSIETIE